MKIASWLCSSHKLNTPLLAAGLFIFDTALQVEDTRRDYKEERIIAYGFIGQQLHVLCFKPITRGHIRVISLSGHIRVISLRKANVREQEKYAEEITTIH